MSWITISRKNDAIFVRVGRYLPPWLARLSIYFLSTVVFCGGATACFQLLVRKDEFFPYFERLNLPSWSYIVVSFLPLFAPLITQYTWVGQLLCEKLVGGWLTIRFTRENIRYYWFGIFFRTYRADSGISFERLAHPNVRHEIWSNQIRRARHPKNLVWAIQFKEYQRTQVVVMRAGPEIATVNIFDRKAAGFGHKADLLVQALHNAFKESQTRAAVMTPEATRNQYGTRPGLA